MQLLYKHPLQVEELLVAEKPLELFFGLMSFH
jgi:hypothetical protein